MEAGLEEKGGGIGGRVGGEREGLEEKGGGVGDRVGGERGRNWI